MDKDKLKPESEGRVIRVESCEKCMTDKRIKHEKLNCPVYKMAMSGTIGHLKYRICCEGEEPEIRFHKNCPLERATPPLDIDKAVEEIAGACYLHYVRHFLGPKREDQAELERARGIKSVHEESTAEVIRAILRNLAPAERGAVERLKKLRDSMPLGHEDVDMGPTYNWMKMAIRLIEGDKEAWARFEAIKTAKGE